MCLALDGKLAATGSSFTLPTGSAGKVLTLTVSFKDDDDNAYILVSSPTTVADSLPTGVPLIRGTVRAGNTVSGDAGSIRDADGLSSPNWKYAWVVGGTTRSTARVWRVPLGFGGQVVQLRVTFTDDSGNTYTRNSRNVTLPADPDPPSITFDFGGTGGD